MAAGENKEGDGGVLGRLAGRGEDAVTRLMDELGRNPRVTDALGRAMSAKGRIDDTTRKTLGQVGLAAADELKDLRKQIERLEKRLAKLETSGGAAAGARQGRKPATATKASGGTPKKAPSGTGTRSSSGTRPRGSGSGSGSGSAS